MYTNGTSNGILAIIYVLNKQKQNKASGFQGKGQGWWNEHEVNKILINKLITANKTKYKSMSVNLA